MEVLTLLDGVEAVGASEAIRIVDMLRDTENGIGQIPVHIFGTTTPAVAATAPGLDDCNSGGKFTGIVATDYQVKIDAIAAIAAAVFTGSGLDDVTSGGTYTGPEDLNYVAEIDLAAGTDTFKWSKDGGLTWEFTDIAIIGGAMTLDNGVTITFGATTGHTLGESWAIACTVDTFKWSNDAGVSWEVIGVSLTGSVQTLELGVTVTFAAVVGHDLNDLWDIATTLVFVGTVKIEGTLATNAEVVAGTAKFSELISKTVEALDKVEQPYTHIRANVTVYTSGTIWTKILV